MNKPISLFVARSFVDVVFSCEIGRYVRSHRTVNARFTLRDGKKLSKMPSFGATTPTCNKRRIQPDKSNEQHRKHISTDSTQTGEGRQNILHSKLSRDDDYDHP